MSFTLPYDMISNVWIQLCSCIYIFVIEFNVIRPIPLMFQELYIMILCGRYTYYMLLLEFLVFIFIFHILLHCIHNAIPTNRSWYVGRSYCDRDFVRYIGTKYFSFDLGHHSIQISRYCGVLTRTKMQPFLCGFSSLTVRQSLSLRNWSNLHVQCIHRQCTILFLSYGYQWMTLYILYILFPT